MTPIPRRRGRRKQFASGLFVRLTAETHDDLIREARARRIDVAVVARERLARSVKNVSQNSPTQKPVATST